MSAALVATVLADRLPARALRDHITLLALDEKPASDALATVLFESVFYRLPPFADDRLPSVAAPVFRRLGRTDAAVLLDGMAAQMTAPAPLHDEDAEAAQIVAAREQDDALLAALERRARTQDWAGSARLFDMVWPCLRPIGAYWVYHRMSALYAALGRRDAALLTAALAIQVDPASQGAREPYTRLFESFEATGRRRDAAELALHQQALCPHAPLLPPAQLRDLLVVAGPLAAPPPAAPWRSHPVFARELRAPTTWPHYGGEMPNKLAELKAPMWRDAVSIAELAHATVLVAGDTVAVLSTDGAVQPELSVGRVPTLLPRRFTELARAGSPPVEVTLDTAVLVNDEFPAPNLCHFLLDHATRLLLYRRAGIDLSAVTAIGPALQTEYQHATVARIGVRAWQPTDAPARLAVRRLFVSSTCRHLQHPAHWGATWAIESVRGLFDVAPCDRSRRLLISRSDTSYRRIANEAEVAAFLAPFGFATINPGRLGFAEQIATFRDATHVIGPHGAGLANILFCAPGTHVLEAFHPHYGTWAYAMAATTLDLDYAALLARDGESDAPELNDPAWPLPHRNVHSDRDIRVDIAQLRRWLADTGAT